MTGHVGSFQQMYFSSSETWILPIIVLFAMLAYALLAIVSTTMMADVWTVNVVNVINVIYQCYQCFQCIICVIDSKTIFLGDGIRIIEFSK